MGITGLLPFLQDASRKCYINEFRGCTVAIDSYCWLHKGAFACADKLVRGETTNIHIMYCVKYIQILLSHNIKPIMVFDGQHLPAKKDTEVKRRERRKTARARATELLRLGQNEKAHQYFRQCVDITHAMALDLIKECRKRNVDCIVAPYEADAQLAYLNLQGIAHIIITEDSDLILFGCSKILFKFGFDGSGTLVEQDKLNMAMKMKPEEYTFDKFRSMCIMSGCDYLDSLPGIGLKKAHKALAMTHDANVYNLLPRLPRYLNLRKLTVSEEYIENFKMADATIRHQLVYDPIKRALVRLTDPEISGIGVEYLKNAGQTFDVDIAFQMALGNIDPFSLKVMDNWSPDESAVCANSKSIWSRQFTKSKSPRKIHHSISVTNTKNDLLIVPSEQMLAMQEQHMQEYDDKLTEELKMYQLIEPPLKRLKVNVKFESDAADEPELKVERNPFSKTKLKNLSKFGVTNVESNQCVKSPFFVSKSKNSTIVVSESEENRNSNTNLNILEQTSEENTITIISKEDELLLDTYSQSTVCSEEKSSSISDETESDGASLKSFAFNKSVKKSDNSIARSFARSNKKKLSSFICDDYEESENFNLVKDSCFSKNNEHTNATSTNLVENREDCSIENEVQINSEDVSSTNLSLTDTPDSNLTDGWISPVLSLHSWVAPINLVENRENCSKEDEIQSNSEDMSSTTQILIDTLDSNLTDRRISPVLSLYSRAASINLVENRENCSKEDDDIQSNSEYMSSTSQSLTNTFDNNLTDGRTSPVLSLQLNFNNGTSIQNSMETFKFNKFKKKINVVLKRRSTNKNNVESDCNNLSLKNDIHNSSSSSGNSKEEEENTRECDIENLTPPESLSNTLHNHKTGPRYDVEKQKHYAAIEALAMIEPFHRGKKRVVTFKDKLRRAPMCRSVGLPRNKKKVANQPTILNMFNKMTSKN